LRFCRLRFFCFKKLQSSTLTLQQFVSSLLFSFLISLYNRYDYGNFPPETYKVQYPAPGSPAVGARICQLLGDSGIRFGRERERGFDHGVFVPLLFLRPEADIPVVQVSLRSDLDARAHIALGRALAPLMDEGVLIIGSGFTFHNFAYQGRPELQLEYSKGFNEWVKDTLVSHTLF
jgi:aromatic ring-opening dioxygenase catalytic subunit (LigB family)